MNQKTQRPAPARERRLTLECKLAAYTLAGGAFLASGDQAAADIVYSGLQNKPVNANSSFELDVNGDGVIDFTFVNYSSGDRGGLTVKPAGTSGVAQDTGNPPPPFAGVMNAGEAMPGVRQLVAGPNRVMASFFTTCSKFGCRNVYNGPWRNVRDKYLGLVFLIPDSPGDHYGWAHISLNPDYTATVHDWAYESIPNQEIVAGDKGGLGEPSSLALLALGAAGVLALLRYRKTTARGDKVNAA